METKSEAIPGVTQVDMPVVAFYSQDTEKTSPVEFVPMVYIDLMKIDPEKDTYSKVYRACMTPSLDKRGFKGSAMCQMPVVFHKGKYYRSQHLDLSELNERLGTEFTDRVHGVVKSLVMAFLFPKGTKQGVADKIIKRYNLENHKPA